MGVVPPPHPDLDAILGPARTPGEEKVPVEPQSIFTKAIVPVPGKKPAFKSVEASVEAEQDSPPPSPKHKPESNSYEPTGFEAPKIAKADVLPVEAELLPSDSPADENSEPTLADMQETSEALDSFSVLADDQEIVVTEGNGSADKPAPPPQFHEEDPIARDGSAEMVIEKGFISMSFEQGEDTLAPPSKEKLKNALGSPMWQDENSRIEIRAYASASQEDASMARRLSLARALAIRDFLIEMPFSPARIDIRALGSETETLPMDRADMLVVYPEAAAP